MNKFKGALATERHTWETVRCAMVGTVPGRFALAAIAFALAAFQLRVGLDATSFHRVFLIASAASWAYIGCVTVYAAFELKRRGTSNGDGADA
ncbi:hypothetical protein [Prescottella agglutinans]|uniref:hypothetical protein n=1 Tax=Prescottella agglutinans TaxID=1644129 RepID=UPI002472E932|nr:hypothetical protein [Prescottella agglutinans]